MHFFCESIGYIFTNLPGNWFNTIVRAFLSIELTLTFPIVIKPASDVVEEILRNVLMVGIKDFNSTLTHYRFFFFFFAQEIRQKTVYKKSL